VRARTTPSRVAACVLAAAAAAGGTSACIDTQPCVSRGTSSQLAGSASYSGQVTSAAGGVTQVYGAVAAAVTVDDFTTTAAACSGNPVEFTVRVGDACTLWAQATDDSGDATIETPATCAVPTAGGIATVALDQGTLSTTSPSSLTLSGTVTALDDATPAGGYLQWTFSGP
jgi:hypothetical protein